MKSLPARRVFLFTCLGLCAAEWPPPRMPNAEEWKQIQQMARQSHIAPSKEAPPPILDRTLPTPVTEAERKAAIERFRNAWFLGSISFGKQSVEADVFLLPNASATRVKVRWSSATDAKGKSVLDTGAAAEAIDMSSGRGDLPLAGADDETEVRKAQGRVVIEAPTGFDELTVACANAGKKQALGKVDLTVERCDHDVFVALAGGLEDDDMVVPLDAEKRALATSESNRSPLFGGKNIEDITLAELQKGPSGVTRVEARAKGTVAFVRWLRPKAAKVTEMDVVATPEPALEGYGASSRVRYVAPGEEAPAGATLDEKALALAFESGRGCAIIGYNSPRVELVLPKVANSLLAKVELAPPKLAGASKGGFELETNGMDQARFRYAWTLAGQGKGGLLSFKTADVSSHVTYPTRLTTRTVKKSEAGANTGVRIDGHHVTVQLGEGEALAEASFSRMHGIAAFDAGGRELKAFSVSTGGDDGMTYAFMGPVDKVTLNVVSGWVERTVTAKLKPAPLRPTGKEGICE